MTSDELAAELHRTLSALELAAQGAFSISMTPGVPNAGRQALIRFQNSSDAATASVNSSLQMFALEMGGSANSFTAAMNLKQAAASGIAMVIAQVTQQLARAIKLGSGTPSASLLKGAGGAIGQVVGQRVTTLTLTARDTSGRVWKSPAGLAQVIGREYAVRALVTASLEDLRAMGVTHAYVGDDKFSLGEIEANLKDLFHPNSKEMPRANP